MRWNATIVGSTSTYPYIYTSLPAISTPSLDKDVESVTAFVLILQLDDLQVLAYTAINS